MSYFVSINRSTVTASVRHPDESGNEKASDLWFVESLTVNTPKEARTRQRALFQQSKPFKKEVFLRRGFLSRRLHFIDFYSLTVSQKNRIHMDRH